MSSLRVRILKLVLQPHERTTKEDLGFTEVPLKHSFKHSHYIPVHDSSSSHFFLQSLFRFTRRKFSLKGSVRNMVLVMYFPFISVTDGTLVVDSTTLYCKFSTSNITTTSITNSIKSNASRLFSTTATYYYWRLYSGQIGAMCQ